MPVKIAIWASLTANMILAILQIYGPRHLPSHAI